MLLLNGFSTSYLLVTNLAFQSTFQMSVKKPKLIKSNHRGQAEERRKLLNSQIELKVKWTKLFNAEGNVGEKFFLFFLFCIWLVKDVVQVFWPNYRVK